MIKGFKWLDNWIAIIMWFTCVFIITVIDSAFVFRQNMSKLLGSPGGPPSYVLGLVSPIYSQKKHRQVVWYGDASIQFIVELLLSQLCYGFRNHRFGDWCDYKVANQTFPPNLMASSPMYLLLRVYGVEKPDFPSKLITQCFQVLCTSLVSKQKTKNYIYIYK